MIEGSDFQQEPVRAVSSISIMGCGCRFYDFEPEPPDHFDATLWLSLVFVPLLPLRRFRSRHGYVDGSSPHFDSSLILIDCERISLGAGRVLATYVWTLLALLITAGPIEFFIWLGRGRAATTFEMLFSLVFLGLGVWLIIRQDGRPQAFLDELDPDAKQLRDNRKCERIEQEQRTWQRTHAMPESWFLCASLIGLVFGATIGRMLGVVDNYILCLFGFIVGAVLSGFLWLIDRMLVWDRDRANPQHEELNDINSANSGVD